LLNWIKPANIFWTYFFANRGRRTAIKMRH